MIFPQFDPVGESIKRCPFLHALVMTEGESFAREVAGNYSKIESAHEDTAATPVERLQNVATNFSLFHGDGGMLPLKTAAPKPSQTCGASVRRPQLSSLPVATISLSSFWSDFNPFRFNQKKGKGRQSSNRQGSSGSKHVPSVGNLAGNAGGQCPLRQVLGPFATAVMSQRYHCPKPIVVMRATIAKLPMVRALRPESIEIKLLAVALASTLLNVPFGMIREHTRKFSPQWFLVVHATIPFIAMFRKAVVMPPYAILFTVAAAIGGQALGAKAERRRLEWISSQQAVDDVEPVCEFAPAASLSTPRICS